MLAIGLSLKKTLRDPRRRPTHPGAILPQVAVCSRRGRLPQKTNETQWPSQPVAPEPATRACRGYISRCGDSAHSGASKSKKLHTGQRPHALVEAEGVATANLAGLSDNQAIGKVGTAGLEIGEGALHGSRRFKGDTGVIE